VLYLERRPAAPLDQYVRMLWLTRAPEIRPRRERILPNGCVQLILNLERDFLRECPEGGPDLPMAPALVVGGRSVYEIISSADMADLMGVVFEPDGFALFAGDAVDRFSNRSIALDDAWGAGTRALRDRLRETTRLDERFACLEAFLLDRWKARAGRRSAEPARAVRYALGRFGRTPALTTVRAVARSTGWSERRFSQVFREEVGHTPKVWCRIQRFQQAVRRLHAGADVRWAEMALDCGFYDQSHFANEFRAFSGVDATTYSALKTQWANHIRVE
jgi:AraC-like DNA-binding protein